MEIISSDKKEKNEIELTIAISPEELDNAVNKAYLKNKNRIGVPGFRKGKAPRKIIEKRYGIAIFMNDALDTLLPEAIEFATASKEFDIVGFPKVSDVDLKDNDTRAEVKLIAALRPDVKLGKYKGLSAPKPEQAVSEDEILKQIEMIRARNARLESVCRPAKTGDVTIIDFEGFLDGVTFEGGKGENYELELGSGRFIPGFEDKLVGMKPGDERDIDLVFPEDYKEDLAGKAVVFKVKLNELKEKQLPELDDEFAKDVSEFDTLDEYKASIREKIEQVRNKEIDEAFEEAIFEQIIEQMETDVPEAMVEEHMYRTKDNMAKQMSAYGMNPEQYMQMMGMSEREYDEKLRERVTKQVRVTLALEEIAKLEKIEVTAEEIEEEYKKAAEQYKTDVDKVKETLDTDMIIHDLKLRAASKLVIDAAKAEPVKKQEKAKKTKETKESK